MEGDESKMTVKKSKKISFTLDLNQIALNRRKFSTEEIGRGIGIHKVSKGKGSYTRKEKHKKKSQGDMGTSFFINFSRCLIESH